MVKGRKVALIVTGIGSLFTIRTLRLLGYSNVEQGALEASFVPAVLGRTYRHPWTRTDWQAELSNDIDDIDSPEHYDPSVMSAPRYRMPSKNMEVLAALGGISLDEAQSLYADAASGETEGWAARVEIAKIRRKAKATASPRHPPQTPTVPRRSVEMKRKQAYNMKEIERARKLSDTSSLSVEYARSTVSEAISGSLSARDLIRQIRQKMKRALARVTPQKAATLAAYGKMSLKEAESMYAKADLGNVDARAAIRQMRSPAQITPVVAMHKQTGRLRRRFIQNMKEIKRAGKLSDTGLLSVDDARDLVVRSRRASLLAQDTIREVRSHNIAPASLLAQHIREVRESAQLQKTLEEVDDSYEIYETADDGFKATRARN